MTPAIPTPNHVVIASNQLHNIIPGPIFNAESDGAVGGLRYSESTDVSVVTLLA